MTQETQTTVDSQQAVAEAVQVTDASVNEDLKDAASPASDDQASPKLNGEEGEPQYRALFKQIIRMRSVRKLSPAAKAAKAARQAARAAANAAKAAEVAAKAADVAAKAAQDAAQAAMDEANKEEKKGVPEKSAPEAAKSEPSKPEEVAAK